jgi:hypothetical protein
MGFITHFLISPSALVVPTAGLDLAGHDGLPSILDPVTYWWWRVTCCCPPVVRC